MKCSIMLHFIWVFTVCQSTRLRVSDIQRVKVGVVMCGSRGGQGVRTPLKNNKKIMFLSNTCPDSLKNHRGAKSDLMLGRHRHATEAPLEWRFDGGPMMAHFWWHLDPLSLYHLSSKKKYVFRFGPLWQNFLDPRMVVKVALGSLVTSM